jgi:hypothetical protein
LSLARRQVSYREAVLDQSFLQFVVRLVSTPDFLDGILELRDYQSLLDKTAGFSMERRLMYLRIPEASGAKRKPEQSVSKTD